MYLIPLVSSSPVRGYPLNDLTHPGMTRFVEKAGISVCIIVNSDVAVITMVN
jgi:hypothetical protein